MTPRRKKRRWQEYGFLVMILLIATELMTMLLGGVITLLFLAYGEPGQSLWAGLITSAVALAAAIAVLSEAAWR